MQTWLPRVRKLSAGKTFTIPGCWDPSLEEMELLCSSCAGSLRFPITSTSRWKAAQGQQAPARSGPTRTIWERTSWGSVPRLLQTGHAPPGFHYVLFLEGWHCQWLPSRKWNPCLPKDHGVRNYVIRNYIYASLSPSPSLSPSFPPSVQTDRRGRTHTYHVHTYPWVYASVCIYTHKVGLFAFSFFSDLSKTTAPNTSMMAANLVLWEENGKSEKSQKSHDSSWDSSKNL